MTTSQRAALRKIVESIDNAADNFGHAVEGGFELDDVKAKYKAAWEAYEQFILTIPFPAINQYGV